MFHELFKSFRIRRITEARAPLLIAAIVYPAWYVVPGYCLPAQFDSLPERLVVGALFFGAYLLAGRNRYRVLLPSLSLALVLVLGAHYLSLVSRNHFDVNYEIGIFPLLVAVNASINRRRDIMIFDSLLILGNALGLQLAGKSVLHPVMTGGLVTVGIMEYVMTSIRLRAKDKLACHRREELEREAQLAQSARLSALGEMAGGVAHEINNPLAIILGRTEQLRAFLEQEEIPREKITRIAINIEDTAKRIEKIVKGLRNLSRDASADPSQDCPLEAVLADTLNLCTEKFRNREVTLLVDRVESGVRFCGRATQISQVILNLLNNALDALETAPKKEVRVQGGECGEWLEIRVSDSGPGIPEAIRERIFQPFFTTKAPGKGTGLGLSISRRIVEDHGGKLLLEPSRSGASFLIQLPRRASETRSAPARAA